MKVKVGIAQMSCVEDKSTNIERYTEKVRELAAEGAQIICLQELFASLYFCDEERYQNFALAEPIPEGPTTQHFMALAREGDSTLQARCEMLKKHRESVLERMEEMQRYLDKVTRKYDFYSKRLKEYEQQQKSLQNS